MLLSAAEDSLERRLCPSQLPGAHACPTCHRIYTYKNNLMRHIRVECGKQPSQMCPYCTYRSKHKGDVLRHLKTRHRDVALFS
ncbi:longitudinals lacking protein, isoforms A/B/D/L-like [Nilaparvata lugens]|uniref:longitudinals lacking protein, isoforms A/B/D/L-like n=1 Tax=Nilaparvata lugens TaxID=108931 RepID=UPI00193CA194|nr:longitudinals lacking protein, isoforms A/B/D/L-like [Nilaparvata lugens]XP_039284623.1 longitudinals lacking protein, isoforms A/B/D/L-like [Nilaparvata lugens]